MIKISHSNFAANPESGSSVIVHLSGLSKLRINLAITILSLVVLAVIFNLTRLDMLVSSLFADGENGFRFSKHWLTDTVLHLYAARVTVTAGVLLIGFNFWQAWSPSFSRRIILSARYLFFSWASSLTVISLLKRVTTLPCPWNLNTFGGSADYLPIYDLFSRSYEIGDCFPSAHASGGYGLIGLGFVAIVFGLPMRKGLILPLAVGLLYGGAQIVRGAHFVSHDLITLALSLSFAWFWAEAYLFWSEAYFGEDATSVLHNNHEARIYQDRGAKK